MRWERGWLYKIAVLNIFLKYTENLSCWQLASNFIERKLRYRSFPMSLIKRFGMDFLLSAFGELLVMFYATNVWSKWKR